MPQDDARSRGYLMGHAGWELERLRLQSTILEPVTRRLLKEASIGPGQRVLDIGCGTGEVSAMLADLVGRDGRVVGIDVSPIAIDRAKALQTPRSNVSFEVAALDDLVDAGPFDLVFGRYVLMHQDEPAGMLRQASRLLSPGGALAFHEIVVLDGFSMSPAMPTWDRMDDYLVGSARTGLRRHDVAGRLVAHFASADLGVPRLFAESLVGEAATSAITTWFAETMRTVRPEIVASRGVSEAEVSIDTLADRLRAEARAVNGQVLSPRQVGAWVRI